MSSLRFFDCHSHPQDTKFELSGLDIDIVLADLKNAGGGTIAIGTDYENTFKALEIAKKHDNVWVTLGVHPADNHNEVWGERFERLYLENKDKFVGVGECGLDYYYFNDQTDVVIEKDRQKKLFVEQIEFAIKYDLPLVLHGRPTKNSMDAYRDMLDILETYFQLETCVHDSEENIAQTGALRGASPSLTPVSTTFSSSSTKNVLKGHAHFFVGNLEIAKRFLNLGFLMSFDGPITFTQEYDEVIKFLPIESIMIETDSPYAAPAPHRGKINVPTYVVHVAEKIATLKGLEVDEVLSVTKENAAKLFKINI